jgi:hypothetical protein
VSRRRQAASSDAIKSPLEKKNPAPQESRNSDYLRSNYELALTVQKMFRKAWPDREKYPDLNACAWVAGRMNIVRARGIKAPKLPPLLGGSAKHARPFLKHLPAARGKLRPLDFRQDPDFEKYPADALPQVWREIMELIDKMDAVERDVRALLDAQHPLTGHRNGAESIAEEVEYAWRRAGEPTPPLSHPPEPRLGPDDPLCIFVTLALQEIGDKYAPDTVSEMLRGRYNRARSGKPKVRSDRPPVKGAD